MGPLQGVKLLEFAGIGPGPFCAMMLADMGAEIVRIDRSDRVQESFPERRSLDLLNRGRKSIGVDLKSPEGVETCLKLVEEADGLLEGFRPGVMERLGLGPDVCLERNPRVVYGRMTGWGQDGPWAHMAGHDINYISIAGVLGHIGKAGGGPVPPLNLVGDFGGGGLILAYGMVCALLERERSGEGQVVDAAMVDGSAVLMSIFHGMQAVGMWSDERGTNLLDTGAHFYDSYECADGGWLGIGAIEPQFYAEFLHLTGLDKENLPPQMDRDRWPEAKEKVAAVIKTKTRDEWEEIFDGTDACVAPILTMREAVEHPHNKARDVFLEVEGGIVEAVQAAPAPRFSRTAPEIPMPPSWPGEQTDEVLRDWGFGDDEVAGLRSRGAIK